MTKWSFEVPIQHLYDFHSDQDFIFALQHLCKDKDYLHYLKDQDLPIIMDNSSNELGHPCSNPDLIDIAEEVDAQAIIAPDQDDWDEQYTYEAYLSLKSYCSKQDIIYVVRNVKELRYAENEGLRITIPYEFRFDTPLYLLKQCDHFLGLNNPIEVRIFKPETVDTGMPIKLALRGINIDLWLRQGCPHIHTTPEYGSHNFFGAVMTHKEILLAKENIKRLKEICDYD
jgi:hypothetical protein